MKIKTLIPFAITVCSCLNAYAQNQPEQTSASVETTQTSISALPQMSGARAAYSKSLSMPIQPIDADKSASKKGVNQMDLEDSSRTLFIADVDLVGNSIFDKDTLRKLVAEDMGKNLTFNQIKSLALKIESFYHEKGYLIVKVIIPKQQMKAGSALKIQILEGKLGKVMVTGNNRYSTDSVVETLYAFTEQGKPFTIEEMEVPLVLLNSRSGIKVTSTLVPGAEPGETDVNIEVKEDARVTGSLEFNNFGATDSGEYRIIPYIALPNLLGFGDELNAFGVISPDFIESWYVQGNYSCPIGVYGTAFNAYFGKGNNQIGNDYAILDIAGKSLLWGSGFSQRFVFSERTSLDLQAWFEWTDTDQEMLGTVTIKDKIRKIRVGGNFDHTDSWGRTFTSFFIYQGLGNNLGGMENDSSLSSRSYAGADNNFTKFVLSVMRLQPFTSRFYGIFNVTGQYSLNPLVSVEQMYSGGANTVRGQPQSCFTGDDGIIANAEIRYRILMESSPYLQLAVFFDHATTHIKDPVIGQKSWSSISGAGVGLRAEVFDCLDLRFDVAVPVGQKCGDDYYLYGQARVRF